MRRTTARATRGASTRCTTSRTRCPTRLERITHSLCTLEFEDHRPLYDWLRERADRRRQAAADRIRAAEPELHRHEQAQAAAAGAAGARDRLGRSAHADDRGLRRRGYTPESIRDFCARIGVAKKENVIDVAQLEHSVREDLNRRAPRVMAVLRPLKVVLTNYPEGQVEEVDVVNNPEDASAGTRKVPFSRVLVHRAGRLPRGSAEKVLPPVAGQGSAAAVRVLHHLHRRVKDAAGRDHGAALHLRSGDARRRCARRPPCEGDDALGVGGARDRGRSAPVRSAVRRRGPGERAGGQDVSRSPQSRIRSRCSSGCQLEPSLAAAEAGAALASSSGSATSASIDDSRPGALVFNRTVSLRDTWARIEQQWHAMADGEIAASLAEGDGAGRLIVAAAAPSSRRGRADRQDISTRRAAQPGARTPRTIRVWTPPNLAARRALRRAVSERRPESVRRRFRTMDGGGWHADDRRGAAIASGTIGSADRRRHRQRRRDRARGIDYLPVPDPFEQHPRRSGADRYLRFRHRRSHAVGQRATIRRSPARRTRALAAPRTAPRALSMRRCRVPACLDGCCSKARRLAPATA